MTNSPWHPPLLLCRLRLCWRPLPLNSPRPSLEQVDGKDLNAENMGVRRPSPGKAAWDMGEYPRALEGHPSPLSQPPKPGSRPHPA